MGLVAVILLSGCGASDGADENSGSEGDFFAGETIRIMLPSGPGGATDTLGRWFGSILERYAAGSPEVVYETVEGAGGVVGMNQYEASWPDDGLHFLTVSGASGLGSWLFGDPAVQYDLRELDFLAGGRGGHVMYISPEAGIEEPSDLLDPAEPLVFGSNTATGAGALSLLALEVLEIAENVQVVLGYESAGPMRVAFEQGEINMVTQTASSIEANVQPLVDAGTAQLLLTAGAAQADGSLGPDPNYPDLPTVQDIYEGMYGEEPSSEAWDAYLTLVGAVGWQPFAIHKSAPEAAKEAVVDAFRAALEDPAFQEEIDDILGTDLLVGAEEWSPLTDTVNNLDPEVRAWIQDWLEENYDISGLVRD